QNLAGHPAVPGSTQDAELVALRIAHLRPEAAINLDEPAHRGVQPRHAVDLRRHRARRSHVKMDAVLHRLRLGHGHEEEHGIAVLGSNDLDPDVAAFELTVGERMEEDVARLRELGATELRFVDEGSCWTVMADPEGDEFCVLRGVAEGAKRDRSGVDSVVLDCGDPFRVAAFWIDALDYRELERSDVGIEIVGPE